MYGRVHWEFSNPGILVRINFNFSRSTMGNDFLFLYLVSNMKGNFSRSCLEAWDWVPEILVLYWCGRLNRRKSHSRLGIEKNVSRWTLMYGNVCSPMETWLCHDQTFEFAFSKVRNCQQRRGGNIFRLPKEEKYAINTISLPWKGFLTWSFYRTRVRSLFTLVTN